MKNRYEIYHKTKALAFGDDHACGEFLQIWDITKDKMPDDSNILFDSDVRLSGLTREKMLAALKEHGFTEKEMGETYLKANEE